MANFEAYQEYQRIEDFEEDSPPGEEDLLVHVPEGLKGKRNSDKNDIVHIRSGKEVEHFGRVRNKIVSYWLDCDLSNVILFIL